MKKIALIVLLVIAAPAAFAEEDNLNPSPWTNQSTYGSQALHKLGFGVKNLLLGWTELIQEPIEQKSALGIVQGLGNGVMDTVGGLLHIITAPITSVDVPLPENGASIWKEM